MIAGLAALIVMLGGGLEARAAGIKLVGGAKQGGGDPPWDYIVQAYLEPGFSVEYHNSFTVENLVGVTPPGYPVPSGAPYLGSSHTEPNGYWSASVFFPNGNSNPVFVNGYPAASITWFYMGPSTITNPNSATSDIYLGQFSVETTLTNIPSSSIPFNSMINYSFTVNGDQSGNGSFQLLNIPEPSSVILLLAGAAVLPLVWNYERRRQRRPAG
jgi:hypothetical protein